MRIRILNSIASVEGWSFVGGEIVTDDHPHLEAAIALARGENAEVLSDVETAVAAPAPERAVAPPSRRKGRP